MLSYITFHFQLFVSNYSCKKLSSCGSQNYLICKSRQNLRGLCVIEVVSCITSQASQRTLTMFVAVVALRGVDNGLPQLSGTQSESLTTRRPAYVINLSPTCTNTLVYYCRECVAKEFSPRVLAPIFSKVYSKISDDKVLVVYIQ